MLQKYDQDIAIAADLYTADDLLNEYGRWAHDRYKKQRCGSAEGRYKAPRNDDEPMVPFIKDFDAMQVHRALIRVPLQERLALFMWYVPKRLPFDAQLRKARIPRKLAIERRNAGLRMFWNIFQKINH